MHVVATAGHVDHGKSTLVRALTGMEPDRFAEERRRGMTIDLGYAWTTLPTGEQLAFVDVPGHQRFIANMLAGLGPAPAVLFVVAADEGWSAQSDEHLLAIDALRVRHGLLAITRSDLADPGPARDDALARLRSSSLGDVEAVAVSATTGAGIVELRSVLSRLVAGLPAPRPQSPVRFWIDRSFTVRGAGTVVTGTLGEGLLTRGDSVTLRDTAVTVRSLQSLGAGHDSVGAVARVALNLRGVEADAVGRGDVLLTPEAFLATGVVDVRLSLFGSDRAAAAVRSGGGIGAPATSGAERAMPRGELVLHVGTAATPVHVRPLGGDVARMTLPRPLPLRAGDRAVLRDPGRRAVVAGVLVLDADPPPLRRRGAAADRAAELARADGIPDAAVEVRRRGLVRRSHLARLGVDTSALGDRHGWLVDPGAWAAWSRELPVTVERWLRDHPLEPAVPRAALRDALDVPDALLADLLADGSVAAGGLVPRDGGVGRREPRTSLGPAERGLTTLLVRLAAAPFRAPDRDTLAELGLGQREITAAVRDGRLVRLEGDVVLAPDAARRAAPILAALAQPFTLSAARQALDTTRRVAVPLLEHLDSLGVTQRVDPTTRRIATAESDFVPNSGPD